MSAVNLLLNTSIIRFRPRNNLYFSFMYLYLNSEYFLRTLTTMATGSIQKNFGPTHLEQIREPFPTSDVLLKFSQLTLPTIKKTLINQKQNQQLT
jgi:type I restriction enzyme S subunit